MSEHIDLALLSKNGILREGLRHILLDQGFTVSSAVSDSSDVEFSSGDHSDTQYIILVDDGFAREGVEHCETLRARFPTARLVILADSFDFDAVVAAFRWGVDGYLVKEISSQPLIGALRLIALGEKVLPSEMATSMGERTHPVGWAVSLSDVSLSEREIEVLQLLILGSANKVIGRCLGICEATVKVHVKAALRKLHVTNRTQAAIWAVQRGLLGYHADQASPTPSRNCRSATGSSFHAPGPPSAMAELTSLSA